MMTLEGPQTEGRLIRPYAITGGRTGKDLPPIALEAMVAATPKGQELKGQLRWEASRVIDLARGGLAVVELAARVDVPIGVIRVVVADLDKLGAVEVTDPLHESTPDTSDEYANLLKKVLDGIQSL